MKLTVLSPFQGILKTGIVWFVAAAATTYLLDVSVAAATTQPEVRQRINAYATACIIDGRDIYVEAKRANGQTLSDLGKELLREPDRWRRFFTGGRFRVPYEELSDQYKLLAIRALFPKDRPSKHDWTHVVTFADAAHGRETLWRVATWFTGNGTSWSAIKRHNGLTRDTIYRGQKIRIPASLLLAPFVTPQRVVTSYGELHFGRDGTGEYAAYRLKKGESIYRDVVRRFTDKGNSKDVMRVCREITDRSGVRDPRRIYPGTEIKIPLHLLSTKYRPFWGDLADVAVILDAGHGGEDPGTLGRLGSYEDEYVYDIMCRVKRLLERDTKARVLTTIIDASDKYRVFDVARFKMDKDEHLLTNPPYYNHNPNMSVNLRWYLANSLCRKLVGEGYSKERIVFTSFHADSLHPRSRGAMVYVPSADYCSGRNGKNEREYNPFKEVREKRYVTFSQDQRVRSEELSRAFAMKLKNAFRNKSLEVQNEPTVRGYGVRDLRGYVIRDRAIYVPAVLRYNEVPVKVLLEVVNLNNITDCKRITNPRFREMVAEAYVQALREFYSM